MAATADPVTWRVAGGRTFGVLPGRARARAARVRAIRLLAVARAGVRLAAEIMLARLGRERSRLALRTRSSSLGRGRARALTALGEAVYAGDAAEIERVKSRLAHIDALLMGVQDELRRTEERMRERIAQARQDSGSTEAVAALRPAEPLTVPEPQPSPQPGPAPSPQPAPVPSPQPGPVVVPEPEPVPHEPPGPAVVPEPDGEPAGRSRVSG